MRKLFWAAVVSMAGSSALACEDIPQTLGALIDAPDRAACLEALLRDVSVETQANILADVLQAAIWQDDEALARDALAAGADVHGVSGRESPLFLASDVGSEALVALLLEGGADPEIGLRFDDGDMVTPLDAAARQGHADIVVQLIAVGADLEGAAPVSPLVAAVQGGHVAAAIALIEAGAPDRRMDGATTQSLLDMALYAPRDTGALIAALIATGHDPLGADGDLLHRAASLGRPEAVRVLVAAGVDVNHLVGNTPRTPLQEAARSETIVAVPALLALGADPTLDLHPALLQARRDRGEPVVAYLDAIGDPQAQARIYSLAAIEAAARGGFGIEDVRRMVAEGADLNLGAGEAHVLNRIGCWFEPRIGEELVALGADPALAVVTPEPAWVAECREFAPDMIPYLEMLGYGG